MFAEKPLFEDLHGFVALLGNCVNAFAVSALYFVFERLSLPRSHTPLRHYGITGLHGAYCWKRLLSRRLNQDGKMSEKAILQQLRAKMIIVEKNP